MKERVNIIVKKEMGDTSRGKGKALEMLVLTKSINGCSCRDTIKENKAIQPRIFCRKAWLLTP
jgi:hypothetical protein